jgi:hypothetical protein
MNMIASNQATAGGAGGSQKIDSKKKDTEGDVNLEELLNDISKDILKIYRSTLNP